MVHDKNNNNLQRVYENEKWSIKKDKYSMKQIAKFVNKFTIDM